MSTEAHSAALQPSRSPATAIVLKMASQTAPISWAQRSDSLYFTINVSDVEKGCTIDLQPTKLSFSGVSHGKTYTAELEFFAEVDPADVVRGREEGACEGRRKGPARGCEPRVGFCG